MNAKPGTLAVRRSGATMRYAVIVVTYLFAAAVIAQFLLAGLALFESGVYWEDHMTVGHSLLPLAILLPVLTAIGRMGRRVTGMAALITVTYLVQITLPALEFGFVAALHPLNGAFLMGTLVTFGARVRKQLPAIAPAEAVPPMGSPSAGAAAGE